jgi:hypothetical protein
MRIAHALPLLALAAGCGDPLVFAEVEEPSVCFTVHNQAMVGTGGATVTDFVYSGTSPVNIGDNVALMNSKGATVNAHVLSFTLTDAKGTADLSGIASASVTISNTAGSTPLLSYTRPANPPKDHLTMAGSSQEIGALLSGGNFNYSVAVSGQPPANDWTANIEVCLYLKVKVDVLQAAGN